MLDHVNGVDSAELLRLLKTKSAAITSAELQGGPPPGGDPAAAGMPPGGDPAAMGAPPAAPPGGDPAAAGALPGDMAAADPMMQLMPMLEQLAMQNQAILDGQSRMMQVFGIIADHLQLKAPASQILTSGGMIGGGGAKKAENPSMDIQDGVVDDEPGVPEVSKVSDFYGTSAGEVPIKSAGSPERSPLAMGDLGLPGDGDAIQIVTRMVAAPAPTRRAVEILRRGRAR